MNWRLTRWLAAGTAAVALASGAAYVAGQAYGSQGERDIPTSRTGALNVVVGGSGTGGGGVVNPTGSAVTNASRPTVSGRVSDATGGGVDLLVISTPVRSTRVQFRAPVDAAGFFSATVPFTLPPGSYLLYADGKFVGTFTVR